jgi:peptidoglycan-associated lipoprotein
MRTTVSRSMFLLAAGTAIACSHAAPPGPVHPPPVAQAAPIRVPAPAPREAAMARAPGADAIYFDFDAALIRDDAQSVLQQIARDLQQAPKTGVRIEGNCDERGTVEYNLALGDKRARAAKEYLMRLGVPETRIEIATYGSERPRAAGHDETAWTQNRRDDLRMQ